MSKFESQFNEIKKQKNREYQAKHVNKKRKEDNKKFKIHEAERKSAYVAKQREVDNEKFKIHEAERQAAYVAKQRELNNEKFKMKEAHRKATYFGKQRELDNEKVLNKWRTESKLSLAKRRTRNPQKLKQQQNEWPQKHRKVETPSDRLREFREATMYNAIFICICCHQRMFSSNVRHFTDDLVNEINKKKSQHVEACIYEYGEKQRWKKTLIGDKEHHFICLTCVRHMKKGKIPPMSAMNGLQLHETDQDIEDQNLKLTELEGTLIAKSIIFQKIYQLPKSRWTALKDRLINVPVQNNDILNTLEQMPRTPKEAGLIGVALKRRKEYVNTHKHQLIDPDKLFRMLRKLKEHGNPHYQFYDDHNAYKERCMESDPVGHDILFNDNDILEEALESMANNETKQDEVIDEIDNSGTEKKEVEEHDETDEEEEKEEMEYETKDPVKKYQFSYDKSLFMTNKYPEMSANGDGS